MLCAIRRSLLYPGQNDIQYAVNTCIPINIREAAQGLFVQAAGRLRFGRDALEPFCNYFNGIQTLGLLAP